MKNKVTYFNKCMHCGETTEFIGRDKNVNEVLTDSDIYRIMSMHTDNIYEQHYCKYCKMQTLQMRTAWKYKE